MSDFKFILKVSRPRFWFYTLGPYLIGLVAAADSLDQMAAVVPLLLAIYFTYPANLLIYGVNDIFDYETDKLNEKKVGYETLVTPERRSALWLAIFAANFAFVGLLLSAEWPIVIASVLFLFFSIFYSAPPVRAKTKPFLDSIFNILYVMPAVLGYALITRELPPLQPIIAAGSWTAAMHAYSAIPDIGVDRKANIHTIATVCGTYGTLAVCFLLYAAAMALSFQYLGLASLTVGSAYLLLMLASIQSARTGGLFKLYRAFPIINVVAGFVLFWTIASAKFL